MTNATDDWMMQELSDVKVEQRALPHQDDMTVRNFYKHMGLRHPMQGMNFDSLEGLTRDGGAYRAFLNYHLREHQLAESGEDDLGTFDHYHLPYDGDEE
jgi:hypothetical protein